VPDTVLSMSGVAVVRQGATLLSDLDWTVREGERWVVLGPNGAGKTTLLQIAGAALFPSRGTVELLGERYGKADLGDLRTRVGLSSAALGDRVPPQERALDVVVTASYGVVGRWNARATCWGGSAWRASPTGVSGRCRRASASGCCWPGR